MLQSGEGAPLTLQICFPRNLYWAQPHSQRGNWAWYLHTSAPGEHLCIPELARQNSSSWADSSSSKHCWPKNSAIDRLENLPEIYKSHHQNPHLLNSRPLFLFSTANFNNIVISAGSTELTHFPFLLVSYEAVSPPKLLWTTHISDLHNHLSIISEYIFIMTAPFLSS